MSSVNIFAPAKINLSLDVVGRKSDGYHLLSTVMQAVDLGDRITVEHQASGQGISLTASQGHIPCDNRNTAWRAAQSFIEAANMNGSVSIRIEKNIPTAAGLAGGSADAAAVIFALNHLLPGQVDEKKLYSIAESVGADVPFCLKGGTVLCEGIGEILTPLAAWPGVPALLIKPPFGMSTPQVFKRFDLDHPGRRPDTKTVLEAVAEQDLGKLAASTANVLESVSLSMHPELAGLRDLLVDHGAALAMMSGSGPTVFGLFRSQSVRDRAALSLGRSLGVKFRLIKTRTISTGPYQIKT